MVRGIYTKEEERPESRKGNRGYYRGKGCIDELHSQWTYTQTAAEEDEIYRCRGGYIHYKA